MSMRAVDRKYVALARCSRCRAWMSLLAVVFIGFLVLGIDAHAGRIPDSEIGELRQKLNASVKEVDSPSAFRRALKRVVRDGRKLTREFPDAPNRYIVLEMMFQSQKRLLAIDSNERNRGTFFEICEELAEAPDIYADMRLEADLMLDERRLTLANASNAERTRALAMLIQRYENTPAEARSLLLGALIAKRLNANELERMIVYKLDENFSDDAEVIAFRREHLSISRLDVTFKGTFKRADGAEVRFPADVAGHLSLMVFWSKDHDASEAFLQSVNDFVTKNPSTFKVFSFNVDRLPDHGESIVRGLGLGWDVMALPEGKASQTYRTYASHDPVAVLVNEYGLAVLRPEIRQGSSFSIDIARISEPRFSSQLQSMFIGDFLIAQPPEAAVSWGESLPREVVEAIDARVVLPPMRYRLSHEQALENYQQLEALCRDALAKYETDSNSWQLRNRLIIALMGRWLLATDIAAMEQAVQVSKQVQAMPLPKGADIVPRFCLAKHKLRFDHEDSESVVSDFLEACGGDDAGPTALAAACILALDAKSREQYHAYRARFLEASESDPKFYAFSSFLKNRYQNYRLLKANHDRRERATRPYIVNHGGAPNREKFPSITLENLDGTPYTLPREDADKMTILMFVEPPADGKADFPVMFDRRGKRTQDPIRRVYEYASSLAEKHKSGGVEVVVAFVTEDADQAKRLAELNEWKHKIVRVPKGLNDPVIRQLGILSADKVANVYVLRRDGTVAWRASGFTYLGEFGFPFAFCLAMKVHIEASEVERGYRALQNGEFQEAVQIFEGPFPPFDPDRFGWRPPRYHGQAVAYMGLKDYDKALEAIDKAIDARKLQHYRGRKPFRVEQWRKNVENFEVKTPCDVLVLLWSTRATILDKLGRSDEAKAMRDRASEPHVTHQASVYSEFHDKFDQIKNEIVVSSEKPTP